MTDSGGDLIAAMGFEQRDAFVDVIDVEGYTPIGNGDEEDLRIEATAWDVIKLGIGAQRPGLE